MASESITIDGKTYVMFDKSRFETLIPEMKASLRFAANLDGIEVALGAYKGKTNISDYNNLIQNPVDIYGRQSEYEGDEDYDSDIEYYKFMADRNGTSPSKIYYIDTEFDTPYYSTSSTSVETGGRKRRRTKSTKKSKRRTKSAKKSKRRKV